MQIDENELKKVLFTLHQARNTTTNETVRSNLQSSIDFLLGWFVDGPDVRYNKEEKETKNDKLR